MQTMAVGPHAQCVVLNSGKFRLAVTTAVGPRVIGGFVGEGRNLFAVLPCEPYGAIGTGWILYGGHRLWHAPEVAPRTYAPDNVPVKVTELAGGAVEFANEPEPLTGIAKSIRIRPLGGERFELTHTLTNRGQWTVALAPWALSVMAPGGTAVIPFARDAKASPYSVDRTLNLWCYSELTDPRLRIGRDFLTLRQDPQASEPLKLGLNCRAGWIAYINQGTELVKHIAYDAGANYPDRHCNVESYSCAQFLEIETLGAEVPLAPGAAAVHVETWHGLSGVGALGTDAEIAANLVARL